MESYAARLLLDAPTPRVSTQRVLVAAGPVSTIGWRGDGRELYYVDGALNVSAISFTPQNDTAVVGEPVKLFTLPGFAAGQSLRVLTNWTARLP